MLFKCAALLAGVASIDGARIGRKNVGTKFIAGTPILNYHLAYGGKASLAELESGKLEGDWILVVDQKTADNKVRALCKVAKCVRSGHPSAGGVPYMEVRGTEGDLEAVIRAGDGTVQFVEPNSEVSMIPEIAGVESSSSWGLDRVGASTASGSGKGVHVYVLDTGVRPSHQDFGGRVIPTLDMTDSWNKECYGRWSCAKDGQGHGTHCAGTVAGNSYGVAPQATIHSAKVLADSGSGSWSWTYDALDWLAFSAKRPAVASMSLGGAGYQSAMRISVNAAVQSGVTVVVAAGNDNSDACGFSPAFVSSAITVGSTTSADVRSDFSNYGSCVQIWAPGSDIVSARHDSDSASRSLSGTSMACPHVSGAAALLLQASPSLRGGAVLDKMKETAINGAISDLKTGDTNTLLWVGAGSPQPAPVAPAPPADCNSAFSSGPDRGGDCKCSSGLSCFESGTSKCSFSLTPAYGSKSAGYFASKCGDACVCK